MAHSQSSTCSSSVASTQGSAPIGGNSGGLSTQSVPIDCESKQGKDGKTFRSPMWKHFTHLVVNNEWLMSSNVVISTMAKSMVAKFDAYWNVIHKLMGVAAVLDPRYKMTLLHFYFPLVYPNDFSEQISNIKRLCYELVEEYYTRMYKETDIKSAEHGTVTSTSKGSSITIDSDYQLFMKRMKTNKTNSFRTELDHYLEEDVLPDNSQFDILLWWKLNGVKYPVLQTIARDILAIPVSTVASESAFSSSGRLVSPHRNRLHPKMIEALMCAQSWLWSEVKKHDGKFI